MKQRPILFSTPMVQAILEGRKTMTRRVVKPQPVDMMYEDENELVGLSEGKSAVMCAGLQQVIQCPYGKPGDILWVRETWGNYGVKYGYYIYKTITAALNEEFVKTRLYQGRWKPSIHMPKEACRLYLRITDVRIERLQDISEADAIAEGIETDNKGHYKCYEKNVGLSEFELETPFWSFSSLWTSINGSESWESNPWVWVIEFKRIEKPE